MSASKKPCRFRPFVQLLEPREVPAQLTFAVDEAISSVTLSGSFSTLAGKLTLQQQGPGSLTTVVDGTIVADVDETNGTIQFLNSSALSLGTSGSWQPAIGGAAGSAAANFGASASAIGITALAAIRSGAVTFTSGALALSGSNPRTFDSTNLTGMLTAGSADYSSNLPVLTPSGTVALTGLSAGNAAGTASSLNLTGATLTLTIPVSISYQVLLGPGFSLTLDIVGSLQASTTLAPSAPYFVVGIGGLAPAGVSQVQAFNSDGTPRLASFDPYSRAKTAGVRVAVGDLTGDGVADIVTGPGPGVAAEVKVFDGADGAAVRGFLAYGATYMNGIHVAVGNVINDADSPGNEIVVSGDGKKVRVFDEMGVLLTQFSPFGVDYKGTVRMAVGDVIGGGLNEIVVARGGPVQVRTFGITGLAASQVIPKFKPVGVKGNPYLAVGHISDKISAGIILGDASGGQVRVFNNNGSLQQTLELTLPDPYGETFTNGVRVGVFDVDDDGLLDILTGAGKAGGQLAKVFQASDGAMMAEFDVFSTYDGGFFVAGT